jgi:CBS-domain-containing membrane protein
MNVTSCMKRNVVYIHAHTTIGEAAQLFIRKRVGFLPIADDNRKPIGIVELGDLLTLETPDILTFLPDVDFVHNFGAVEDTHPSAKTLKKNVETLMKPAFTIEEDCGLLRAYSLMVQHKQHYVIVVSRDGSLAGIVSRVDIGVAILSTWQKAGE